MSAEIITLPGAARMSPAEAVLALLAKEGVSNTNSLAIALCTSPSGAIVRLRRLEKKGIIRCLGHRRNPTYGGRGRVFEWEAV